MNEQMGNNDAVAARRRALAAALRSGDDVVVTPTGEVEFQTEAEEQGHTAIQVPDGKLAEEELRWDFIGIRTILIY